MSAAYVLFKLCRPEFLITYIDKLRIK